MSVFAALSALGFVAAYVGPTGAALAEADPSQAATTIYANAVDQAQSYDVEVSGEAAGVDLSRGNYTVYVKPKPKPVVVAEPAAAAEEAGGGWAPPFVSPDPGTAQAIAYEMVIGRGWNDAEFACLVALWNKESGWRVNAYNAGSGAYGIPQSLPGSKMATAGADWETNPATQISWGLGYIGGRYGSPCGAWGHSQSVGWY